MARVFGNLLSRFGSSKTVKPTKTVGVPGTAIWGGFIQEDEKNAALTGTEKYRTYADILANTSIVAASTRYFLNLIAKAEWTFTPSEADTDGKFAELAEKMLTEDPVTPWHRIVRRAAMYRFYGFSIQEWTARRAEEGYLTFRDIAPRPQLTITRWDRDEDQSSVTFGDIVGVTQTSPQTQEEIYLPRKKLLYMVDDTLSDSPEGLGLFRHLVAPAQRLARYEQLEGFGFETDLRGIPVGRAPLTELRKQVEDGDISKEQRTTAEAPLRDFIRNHIKTAKLGMLLDSITYQSEDEASTPSDVRQWDVELLKGSATSFKENAAAIERLNRELARILGTEQLMLGSSSAGSFALSQDKTNSFFLLVDGSLLEIRETVADDLLASVWALNGLPEEMKPELGTEAVRHTDVEQVAATLRDMATAGAPLDDRDPVVNDVRELLGVSQRPPELISMGEEGDEDASLSGPKPKDDNIPDDDEKDGDE